MEQEGKSPDRMIAESAALGVAVGGIVALLVNLIGVKKFIFLCLVGYIVYKLWWK